MHTNILISIVKKISQLLILSLLPLLSATSSFAATEADNSTLLSSLPTYSTTYDPKRDAFKDGASAVKLATETNRRILIELGGDWCKWCHVMDEFFDKNPDIKQQLHETFVMLKINVSDANNNAEFLKSFPRPLGYPHMYVSEYNGSVLWSQDTGEFVNKGQYTRESFLAFFKRWKIKSTALSEIKK